MDGLIPWLEEKIECKVRELKHWHKRIKLNEWILKLNNTATGTVDSSGNMSLRVYRNVTGRNLVVGRVVVLADGVTPAAPHNSGGGTEWAGIFAGAGANLAQMLDFIPDSLAGQMFPQVAEYSGHNALRFGLGEDIYFELRGSTLASGTKIHVRVVGAMEPTDSDFDL